MGGGGIDEMPRKRIYDLEFKIKTFNSSKEDSDIQKIMIFKDFEEKSEEEEDSKVVVAVLAIVI